MPIIQAHRAKTIYILKRGQGKGFSVLTIKPSTMESTRMIYGDAKATLSKLVAKLKGA